MRSADAGTSARRDGSLQLVLNGLMAGTILAVPAIGLTAIFAVLRFTNFALASHVTIGAFAGFVANVTLRHADLSPRWSPPSWWPGWSGWPATSWS